MAYFHCYQLNLSRGLKMQIGFSCVPKQLPFSGKGLKPVGITKQCWSKEVERQC